MKILLKDSLQNVRVSSLLKDIFELMNLWIRQKNLDIKVQYVLYQKESS